MRIIFSLRSVVTLGAPTGPHVASRRSRTAFIEGVSVKKLIPQHYFTELSDSFDDFGPSLVTIMGGYEV